MRLQFKYRDYPDCPEATKYSASAAYMPTLLWSGPLTVGVLVGSANTYAGIIAAAVSVVLILIWWKHLKRREKECLAVYVMEQQMGRTLSAEEKTALFDQLKKGAP